MIHRGARRLSGFIIVVLVALILSLAFASVAQAQTSGPVVTTLLDSGAGSLRDAVATAAPGETITFASGLTGTITVGSTIDINKNLSISGPGKGKITISGGHTVGVFEILAGNTVTITCLTIRDGDNISGGGILNRGTLTVDGVEFGNNTATGGGGAIHNEATGILTIKGGRFIANSANLGGAVLNNGSLTINGGSFENNGSSTDGGAVVNLGTNATITKSYFSGNLAQSGGAIWSQSPLVITESSLSGNNGTINGGALMVTNSTASITSSCIKGNKTPATGYDAELLAGPGALTAEGNWWGAPTGPNTPGADTANITVGTYLNEVAPACTPHSDGRANPGHGDDYAIIFPAYDDIGKPDLHVYCVNEMGSGYLGMIVTQAMVDKYPDKPEENIKIADTEKCRVHISFYLLTTGEYQVNIGPKPNGDVAVIIFTGMPPEHIYYRDFNIFDLEWPIEVPPAEPPVLPTVTPVATP